MQISIIIPCRNEGNNIKDTLKSIIKAKTAVKYEIIVVNNGSTDGCCDMLRNKKLILKNSPITGVAQAKNYGASFANGIYLMFCDAHIEVKDYWLDKMVHTLKKYNADVVSPAIMDSKTHVIGYGQTLDLQLDTQWITNKNNNEILLCPGGAMLIKRCIFNKIGGFDNHFKIWGYEDQEISLRLWRYGYKIICDKDTVITHIFRNENKYNIDSSIQIYNFLYYILIHFKKSNLETLLNKCVNENNFSQILSHLLCSKDVIMRRYQLDNNSVVNIDDLLKFRDKEIPEF